MHKLQSTISVLYNAEEQKSGVLEICICDITFENIPEHKVRIVAKLSCGETPIKSMVYMIDEATWDAFVSSADGNSMEGIALCGLKYVKSQVGSKYGLLENEWELVDH